MGCIWFDVTSIIGWNRPPVGIIRMEAECARHALEMVTPSVRFCKFDASLGYTIVESQEVRLVLERLAQDHSTLPPLPPSPKAHTGRIRRLGQRALAQLPVRFRDPARRLAIASIDIVNETRRSLPKLARVPYLSTQIRPAVAAPPKRSEVKRAIPFAEDDVYVSLGLDWDTKVPVFIAEQKILIGFKGLFCCYDIIPVTFPHLCVGDVASKFARYFADIAWCADEIVAISECSKRDLLQLLTRLGAPTPDVFVVKLGTELRTPTDHLVSEETRTSAAERFVLYVSTIERRKNHETIYRAITRLIDKGSVEVPRFVFVGMPGWGVADLLKDFQLDPRVRDKIKILNNVNDADLAWLYQRALFTVFPSLYEGWGLAVGESLAAGKFCLCSNVASLPEVGGDLVEYLDPWDVQAWADRLEHYVTHPEDLARRERSIREQYIPPKWSDTASGVFERAQRLLALAPARSVAQHDSEIGRGS